MSQTVRLIILGACGYMGSNALLSLDGLNSEMQKEGVSIRVEACVDTTFIDSTAQDDWLSILQFCKDKTGYVARTASRLAEYLKIIEDLGYASHDPILVYDATPTHLHPVHLEQLFQANYPNIFYVGEKPMLMDTSDIIRLEKLDPSFKVYCEFIETVNPVLETLQNHIVRNGLKIKKMNFWRAGSTAIKKMIEADRPGIAGGALLDKAPHDLSITIALLEAKNIVSYEVVDAQIEYFCISPACLLGQRRGRFLDAKNNSSVLIQTEYKSGRSDLTADAVLSATVKWKLRDTCLLTTDDEVVVDYLFSWVGYTGEYAVEQDLTRQLNRVGLAQTDWLMTMPAYGPMKMGVAPHHQQDISKATHECDQEEVRVGIIECQDRTIVCNFLTDKIERDGQLRPFVYEFKNGKRSENLVEQNAKTSYKEIKGRDLGVVFARAYRDYIKKEDAVLIDRIATIWVHRVLLDIQNAAFDRLKRPVVEDEWFSKVQPLYDKKIRVKRT